ncbi:hypothetical protein ACVFYP_22280 [Roseomonas sp. F4]
MTDPILVDPRAYFRDLAVTRLKALLPALAPRISSSNMLPVPGAGQSGASTPGIMVFCDRLRGTTLANGVGQPSYRTIVSLTVVLRYEQRLTAELEAKLDVLAQLVRAGLLTDQAFMAAFEECEQFEVTRSSVADGERQVGQDAITFDLRCTEEFEPVIADRLAAAHLVMDALDPADPLGAYPGLAGFPAPAAPPRATGPDGRAEAEVRIAYPQP